MNRPHRTACLIAPLVLLLAAPALAEPVELRLQLEEGRTYEVDIEIDQQVEQVVQGFRQEIDQSIGMGYRYEVLEAEAGGDQRLRVTCESVRMRAGGPMAVDFDSERDADEPVPLMARGIAAMVGQTFEVALTPRGRVSELSGVEEMLDNMLAELGDVLGPMRGMIEGQMRNQFGEEALRGQWEAMSVIYPEEAVDVGDEWEHEIEVTVGFPAVVHTTYTLESREGGVATVAMASRLTPPADPQPMEMGEMRMTMSMEGDWNGSLRIDEATGWVRELTIDQDTEGETLMEAPGLPEPMAIPMKIAGTVKMTTRE